MACSGFTTQYSFASYTNAGAWSSYTPWSTTPSVTQSASEGYKYGYKAQSRCYVSTTYSGTPSTDGAETDYVNLITTVPAAPAINVSLIDWQTTNYSWSTPSSCPLGTTGNYQYDYRNDSGYNSGWVTTGVTTIGETTAHFGYNYYVKIKAQCANAYTAGGWGSEGPEVGYLRPFPSIQVLIVAGGGGGGGKGGGGAGGYYYNGSYSIGQTTYGVTVGGGGAGTTGVGSRGVDSIFNGITRYGGGGGGDSGADAGTYGSGAGGGGTQHNSSNSASSGTGGQGRNGGTAYANNNAGSGGWRRL
ncbi:MAG: glycine-rich domain-containing protein [Candidatus Saccharibacteria bacterium]